MGFQQGSGNRWKVVLHDLIYADGPVLWIANHGGGGAVTPPVEPSRPSGGTADRGDGLIYIDDDEIPLTGDKGNFLAAGACMVLAAGVVVAATSIKRKKK